MADSADNIQTAVVADIDLKQIICALHVKAVKEAVKDKQYKIQNTAIDMNGDDDKSAKFYGAGTHMIAAIPTDIKEGETGSIPKSEALKMLQAYAQWYSGPDTAKKITADKLIALEDGKTGASEESSKDTTSKKTASSPAESLVIPIIPSFKQWLLTEEGEADSEPPASGEAEGDKDPDADTEPPTSGEPEGDKDPEAEESAPGYYVTYKLKVEGQQEVTTGEIFKKAAGDWIKSIGLANWDWRSGSEGKAVTIGELADEFDKVFGKIDPDELNTTYSANLKKKFPKGDAISDVWDTKTILQYLKKDIAPKDAKRIRDAEYAICTRVNKNDKSYKLYKPAVIADLITSSIKGIVKIFKNRIKPDDVILVNNYSDNKKENGEDKKYIDKDEGTVVDSLSRHDYRTMIVEDGEPTEKEKNTVEDVQKKLDEIAADKLKDYSPTTKADTTENIVSYLKSEGIDEPELFSKLQGAAHSFLIQLKQPISKDSSTKPTESIDVSHSLLSFLFEKALENNDKAIVENVRKCFMNFVMSYKAYDKDGKEANPDISFIKDIAGYVSDKEPEAPTESYKDTLGLFNLLYEDEAMLDEAKLADLLLEGHNVGKGVALQIIDQKGAKNLAAALPKMQMFIKANYKTKKGENKEESLRYKALGLLEQFAKLTTEDDMKKFVDSKFEDGGKDTKDNQLRTAFIRAMQIDGIPDKDDSKEQKKVKITFYDSDPKTGEKLDKPLGDPIEIDANTKPNASEEIVDAQAKYNKQLSDDKKDGYEFKGWSPETSEAADEDTDIVAKYIEDDKKDEKFTVMFQYAPDPEKPDDIKPIEVDGKEKQEIAAGEKAVVPEAPKIDGYEFKEWDADGADFDNVDKDIMAVAKYEKAADKEPEKSADTDKIAVYYAIPDMTGILNEEKEAEAKDNEVKAKHTDYDFYIVPMKGLKRKEDKSAEGK